MKKRVLKKTFFTLAFLGMLSVQVNGQSYDFDENMNDWIPYNATNQTVTYQGSEGLYSDGAIRLERATGTTGGTNNGNNAGISYDGAALDLDTYQYIRIRYKNETKATNFRVQGYGGGNNVYTIGAESDLYSTAYIDMSGEASWTGSQTGFSILVRTNAPDDANTYVYFDEIEFLTSLPATQYSEFIQNPSFEDPTGDSFLSGAIDDADRAYIHLATAKDGNGVLRFKYNQDQTKTQYTFSTFEKSYSPALTSGADQLQVKMWVRTNRSIPFTMSVRVNTRMDNGAGGYVTKNRTENITTTNTNMEWEQLTFNFTTNQDVDLIRLWFAPLHAGTVNDFDSGDILYIDKMTSGVFPLKSSTSAGNWATGASWVGGTVPDQGDQKTINSNIDVNSAVVSDGPIDVTTGNTLTIKAGNSLTLNSDINIDGTLNLEAGAQLIVKGNSNGNASFVRTLPAATSDGAAGNLEGWFSMAAPFSGAALNNAWANAGTNNIATSDDTTKRGIGWYTESSDAFTYLLANDGNSTTFEAGKGYIIKQTSAGDISFTGTINSNEDGVDVTVTKAGNGFNLLGSPYSALVNSGTFLTDTNNSDLFASSEIWVWNDDGNTYESKPSGDNFMLSPGQAFFVQVNGGGTLNFKQSNQSIGGDTFQKSSRAEVILNVNNGKTNRYAKVNYLNNSTLGYDIGYEGKVFEGIPNSFSIYTHLLQNNDSKKYQIQSLPKSDLESMVIPVGIDVDESSEITFTLEAKNIPSGLKVFLEDRQEGVFTQLDVANSEYKVSLSEVSNGTGRFFLHIRSSVLSTDDVFLNSISVFKSSANTLKIAGLKTGKVSVSLFNILGKQVMSKIFTTSSTSETLTLPNLAKGVYVVKLTTEQGKLNKKIILE